MSITATIHRRLGDPFDPASFSARCRAVRWREFLRRFPELHRCRVLDLGGTPDYWRSHAAQARPLHVTTVNIDPFDGADWITHIVGDACDMSILDQVGEHDLVVSNSLLEHVGGYERRRQLAEVIHAAAYFHWVQTPTRSFPVEPHYVFPLLQHLPLRMRASVVRRWPLNHVPVRTRREAMEQVLATELVSATEMRHLFPRSEIWHERWCGLSKSLVATKP